MKIRLVLMLAALSAAYIAGDAYASEALRFYESVVSAQPSNANAKFDLGNVYLSEKRYEEALKQYNELDTGALAASRLDDYYFNLSVCYAGLGSMEEAVRSMESCVSVNPDRRDAAELLTLYRNRSRSLSPSSFALKR